MKMKLVTQETRHFRFTQDGLKKALGIEGPGRLQIARLVGMRPQQFAMFHFDAAEESYPGDVVEIQLVHETETEQ